MSSKGEMESGLRMGQHQGIKSGMVFSRMDSGVKKGVISDIGKHNKTQDPTVGLLGSKKPVIFWLADYTNATVTSTNITTIYNLMQGGTNLSNAGSGSLTWVYNGMLNNKSYIDLNTYDIILSTAGYLGGKTEMTLMMVARLAYPSVNSTLFSFASTTSADTIGDILVSSNLGQTISVRFVGNPNSTISQYQTFDPLVQGVNNNNWFLLTVKCRLYQPGGQGSEMEIYVNGKLNMTPITTTFGGSTSTFTNAVTPAFGNIATPHASGGSQIAGALLLDYWANSSEQIRLENFFRWYYGFKF